ncbi:hypothetical protein LC048_24075 [Mesobacillus subterraneus]|nr:hypothetical protein [Mesobacillus subterraneus]WLR55306.1 hypothetical protein LC048_24075 [Mesobacillus subterraneus]
MKSFFDFIGRIEASRGARRCSWTFLEVKFILPNLFKRSNMRHLSN